jgi:hypothetical protein
MPSPLTSYWDNGFCIARAWSACCGKSGPGLNVVATEGTIVETRTVVCALHAMPSKQIGASMAASVQVAAGRARNRCVRLPYPWRSPFSPLRSAVAFLCRP